jgi:hypothetical protein
MHHLIRGDAARIPLPDETSFLDQIAETAT